MADDNRLSHLSRLERLPSLVLRDIMVLLAVPDIHSLTTVSRTFFVMYRYEGTYIMRESLIKTLGYRTFVDTVALHRAPPAALKRTGSRQSVIDYLDKYRRQMAGEPIPPLQRREIIAIAKRHWLKIIPFVNIVGRWAMDALSDEISARNVAEMQTMLTRPWPDHRFSERDERDDAARKPLSPTERARITRALYRYEIHNQLFFDDEYWPGIEDEATGLGVHFGAVERAVLFTTLYEPWEAEEVLCVDDRVYTWLFRTVHSLGRQAGQTAEDLGQLNIVRTSPSSPQPLAEWLPAAPRIHPLFDLGPSFVHAVNAGTNIGALRREFKRAYDGLFDMITQIRQDFQPGRLDEWKLRDEWEQRLEWERHREPLPFCGDQIESAPSTSPRTSVAGLRPPLVWSLAFQETYSNQCLPFRPWGYVLWDADRIEKSGMDLLIEERMREFPM